MGERPVVRDSKATLLAAGAEEFAQHGLRGTRIQAIVRRAGVNERMIYHHFGSKEGLYRAVVEAQMREVAEAWWPVLAEAGGQEPYQGMRAVLRGFFRIIRGRPLFVKLMLQETLADWSGRPAAAPDQLPLPVRKLYEQGQDQGVFRRDQPFELAYGTAVSAMMARVIFAARDAEIAKSVPLTDEAVIDLLLDGMTGNSP